MPVQTAAGSQIYVSNAASTATTQVNFEAETYIAVGEVSNIGEFGSTFSAINFTALADRIVRKFKGTEDPGTVALQLGLDPSDTGQDQMRTALASDDDFAFKITLNDAGTGSPSSPTTFYFRAKVMSFRNTVGGPDNVVTAACDLGINTRPIMVDAV